MDCGGLAGVITQLAHDACTLAQCALDRTAHVQCAERGKLLEVLVDEISQPQEQNLPLGRADLLQGPLKACRAAATARNVPANALPSDEVPDEEYPMVLSTGRVLEHWRTGSMTRRAGVLDAIEPEAVSFMSPRELWRAKLTPCDFIRIETRRGL